MAAVNVHMCQDAEMELANDPDVTGVGSFGVAPRSSGKIPVMMVLVGQAAMVRPCA